MSLTSILTNLIIGPLKLVFEIVFFIAHRLTGNPSLSILVLSLVMNILVLPLYRRADAMQERARDTEAKLHRGVAHIKKTFSGDERMMILQTYYRQNNYRPTDVLNGSISLLLEIPFFMAAYQFLSHAEVFAGVSLGPIADLSQPDGLLAIGSLTTNLLPFVMTAVNCISSALYLKGFPLKTKLQLYGIALFFLIFLYNSPACLLLYWTLNNLFSLFKNIARKLKNPRRVLTWLAFCFGLVSIGAAVLYASSVKSKVVLLLLGVLLAAPVVCSLMTGRFPGLGRKNTSQPQSDPRVFWMGGLFLTILVGGLIPSSVLAASPLEFVNTAYFHHPLWYVAGSLSLAAGTFLVWMGIFYWLADSKGKVRFQQLIWILCGIALMDYLFFGTNLGILTTFLQYETGMDFSAVEELKNMLAVAAVAVLMFLILQKYRRSAAPVLLTMLIALSCMTVSNVYRVKQSVEQVSNDARLAAFSLPMSKSGKNVVVIMLDRGIGEFVPYLFQEKPELKESFDGFTYYPNTISFGPSTNFCVPALMGGYEYTPVEMNKRSDESLASKHNEALLVMPTLFADNGYQVTVCNPPYANYSWLSDLSLYRQDPRIHAYRTMDYFTNSAEEAVRIQTRHRNFFLFSLMKTLPLCLQETLYNGGNYNQSNPYRMPEQYLDSMSTAHGKPSDFLEQYEVLQSLPMLTTFTEDSGTCLIFTSNITHAPVLLQEPDYSVAEVVDNTAYDAENVDRFTVDGKTLRFENIVQMTHYHANMAAMLQLRNWFDFLRENGVYDNTRIILVSDHAYTLNQSDGMTGDSPSDLANVEHYLPLLMVKDFDSHGFSVSEAFMTNADVPTLAVSGVISDPVNPFTGTPISSAEKTAHDQFVLLSDKFDILVNNGNTFLPDYWASVAGNPRDLKNWRFYSEKTVLDRHAAP